MAEFVIPGAARVIGNLVVEGDLGTFEFTGDEIKLPNEGTIRWRNFADDANLIGLTVDDNDILNIGGIGIVAIQIGNPLRGGSSAAYALLNETASQTNPTLIPNRGDLTTGIGAFDTGPGGFQLNLVVQGKNVVQIDGFGSNFVTLNAATLDVNGQIIADGIEDKPQLTARGHSTQTSDIFVVETNAGVDLLTVSNAGVLTLRAGTGDIVFPNVEQQILWQGCSTYFIANLDTPDELFFGNQTVSVGNAVFSLENAQVFKFRLGAQNEQFMSVRVASQLVATPSGATATATNVIPAGAFVIGVTTRVTTLVTGPAGYDVGDGVNTDRWGNSIAVALGTTSDPTDFVSSALEIFPAANDVVITSDGVDFTGGAIRITVHYMTLTAPTS